MDFHRDSVFSDIQYIFCYKMLFQGMLAHDYNPQTGERETKRSRVQGQSLQLTSSRSGYTQTLSKIFLKNDRKMEAKDQAQQCIPITPCSVCEDKFKNSLFFIVSFRSPRTRELDSVLKKSVKPFSQSNHLLCEGWGGVQQFPLRQNIPAQVFFWGGGQG